MNNKIYKTIIFPVVLYRCENWTFDIKGRTITAKYLRRGCWAEEITGGWRKLHNVDLQNLYSSPNIGRVIKPPRRIRWVEHVACIGERGKYTKFWWESQKERDH
jgi:hypothetical protein